MFRVLCLGTIVALVAAGHAIDDAVSPSIAEYQTDLYRSYKLASHPTGLPLAHIFSSSPEERTQLSNNLWPLVQKLTGRVNFVNVNATLDAWWALDLHLKNDSWPAFAIQEPLGNLKYPLPEQGKDLSIETITAFIESFLSHELKPTVKSQPLPTSQTGPVTVVVARNYDSIVLDDSKDVLLEYHNPSCRACQNFAPTYDELGELFRDFADEVTIAKIDETANDVPHEIEVWPIIRLFRAGNKGEYVDYGGDASVEDLVRFVRDEGGNGVDALEGKGGAGGDHGEL